MCGARPLLKMVLPCSITNPTPAAALLIQTPRERARHLLCTFAPLDLPWFPRKRMTMQLRQTDVRTRRPDRVKKQNMGPSRWKKDYCSCRSENRPRPEFFPSKQEEIRWRQRRDRGLRGWVQPTRFYSAANADVMRANVQKVNKDIKGRGG